VIPLWPCRGGNMSKSLSPVATLLIEALNRLQERGTQTTTRGD
jgi:hypothetical protein